MRRAYAVALSLSAAIMAGCGGDGVPTTPGSPAAISLSGTVTSARTAIGIEGATVTITEGPASGRMARTDERGQFRIAQVPLGSAIIVVRREGYDDLTRTVAIWASLREDFAMERTPCTIASCSAEPAPCNEMLPFLRPPFDGRVRAINLLDHDAPLGFADGNGIFRSYCGGANGAGRLDGHAGYDWLMPIGTAVSAPASGIITAAGTEGPFFCALLGREVRDGQYVFINHISPAAESFQSRFLHLSRVDVRSGQIIAQGEVIGLSGNSGCSTVPHLHFEVRRLGRSGLLVPTDPYGWQGAGADPWSARPDGAYSAWLWEVAPPLLR